LDRTVFDEDIMVLLGDDSALNERIKFISLSVKAGSDGQSATLELEIDGELKKAEAEGNGPVDAIFNAIRSIFPHPDNPEKWLRLPSDFPTEGWPGSWHPIPAC
jgi:hypothetical protein